MPIAVDMIDAGNGWQDLSIELGVRNDGAMPFQVAFPGAETGASVTIAEGRTYDTSFAGWEQFAYGPFILGPGLAFCGGVWGGVSSLLTPKTMFLSGRIPVDTTPISAIVPGYPPVDLSETESESTCVSDASAFPLATEPISLGTEGGAVYANVRLNLGEDGRMLNVELENRNPFDNFGLADLRVWAGYDNGIWASAASCESGDTLPSGGIGPKQTLAFDLCLPSTNHPVVVLAAAAASSGAYGAVQTGAAPPDEAIVDPGEGGVRVALREMNGSGANGEAVLQPYEDETLLAFVGVGSYEAYSDATAFIVGGTCDALDLTNAYSSGFRVEEQEDNIYSGVYLALPDLLSEPHAIIVGSGGYLQYPEAAAENLIACGEIQASE